MLQGHGHRHGHSHGGDGERQPLVSSAGHGHGHGGAGSTNINVRAAFIHVVGDLIQSVGVFVAALVIYLRPELKQVDPICTFVFSVIVLLTTVAILKDALTVLMEGSHPARRFPTIAGSGSVESSGSMDLFR